MRYDNRHDDALDRIRSSSDSSKKLLMPGAVMACRTSAANDENARVHPSTIAKPGAEHSGEALHWITAEWPADALRDCLSANKTLSSH